MELTNWWQLSDRGPDLVLCLDYPGGRAEAGFAELAAGVDAGVSFLHIRHPVTGGLDDSVRRWVAEVTATGRPVRAVLGFCAGAALAPCVADALAGTGLAGGGPAPEVVLFDAVRTTGGSLAGQLPAALETSAAHLTADELEGARLLADELVETHPDDLAAIAARVVERYDLLMGAVAARLGLAEFFRQELTGGFSAYLHYLCLAAGGRFDTRSGAPTFLSSAEHEPPVEDGKHVVLDVEHTDLLRDASVHELVAGLLRGEPRW